MSKRIIAGLIIVIAVLSVITLRACQGEKEADRLYEAAMDTLSLTVNTNGQQVAKIKSFKAEKESAFLEMQSKDSTILWLQDVVKETNGKLAAAVVASTITKDESSSITAVIIDSTSSEYPIYKTEWNEKWSKGEIIASKDSIKRDIVFKNDFQITISNKSNKLFKRREMMLELTNLNPNTQTNSVRSFIVKNDPKRINLGIQTGYGVDVLTFKPVLYVGVGVSFTVVGIK